MSKRLMLMRHAESPQLTDRIDFERPLSEYGVRQALATGTFLLSQNWVPDVILVSDAGRTLHTAQLVAATAKTDTGKIVSVNALYNALPGKILNVIHKMNMPEGADTLLIIAHNPGVSQLAMECCRETKAMYFPPAAIVGFEMFVNVDWHRFSVGDTRFSFYQEPQL